MARACQAARTMAVLLTPIKEIQSCVLLLSLKQHALAMKVSYPRFFVYCLMGARLTSDEYLFRQAH
ncbi:hypothetical protein HMPREF1487_07509 [Pseudomonas sp. HPB0071]|uniref:Uncharacterized protein n=1 Tax=Pseudomonas luteola TaxID=47886 RepID=A0A2X2CP10_PSELU|nr:hypothetical protein HMPREF1487_07509 [Pseudomonas sp. HPB0071]SHJ45584.1 hypothetical protein SAMN05216295_11438 [Pseudomonas zeshuii]SPZ09668.1 Uncharacterised protein [Pseudomonas luteola]